MSSDAERPTPGPDGTYGDWRRHDEPETAAWMEPTSRALERWGAAYLAYLLLPDADPTSPTAEQDFIDSYAGWYPDQASLIRAQLENLGWTDALAAQLTELALPPLALHFDLERLWQHCTDVYDVVERLPGVHAFFR